MTIQGRVSAPDEGEVRVADSQRAPRRPAQRGGRQDTGASPPNQGWRSCSQITNILAKNSLKIRHVATHGALSNA